MHLFSLSKVKLTEDITLTFVIKQLKKTFI